MHSLKTHEFHVEIDAPDITDDLVDLVFEAKCDDAILCKDDRVVYLSFRREAYDRDFAVATAIRALRNVGMPLIVNEEQLASN